MIIWLASYPKSGNTLLRSMLSSYFFSSDGIYNFNLIKNINQFPVAKVFHELGIDINNDKEMIQNYIKVQEYINQNNSAKFLKTHSQLINYENKYPFTNLKNTLGVIYVVRDPRNIVSSFADFGSGDLNYYTKLITENLSIGGDPSAKLSSPNRTFVITGTWASNYKSWKTLKEVNRYLLIKYEDLIKDRESVFKKIIKFIYYLNKSKPLIDKKKFYNVLKSTDFDNLKNLEAKHGFSESTIDKKTGKKKAFFKLGPKRDWRKDLDHNIRIKIEKTFESEMKELGYL